jgi:integrase
MTDESNPRPILASDNPLLSEPTGPVQAASLPAPLPVEELPASVLQYVQAAYSENTRHAYRSDLRHFLDWGGAIPTADRILAEYLAVHAGTLSVATLERRVAAISKAHTTQGLRSPTASALVKMTMAGIRRKHGRPQHQVAAAVRDDILAMVADLGDTCIDRRDKALLLIGFAGAFRRSELRAINCTDVEHVPEGIVITIRRSKVDQEERGRRIGIPYAQGDVCPVKSLDAWLRTSGICDGARFRPINRHGQIAGSALSPEAVAVIVKKRATAAGLDSSRYAGHSLRAGLATSAAAAGVPPWKIREQTGHAADTMLQRYIRDGDLFKANASGAVL